MILHYVTKEINSLLISNIVWWCLLAGFLEFQHKKKNSYLRHAWQRSNIMKVTVTVRLSLVRPCDETSTMLSIALCLFFFNWWAATVQSSSSADLAAEHLFFSPIDESQNVKLYWNVDAAKKDILFTVEAKTTGWVGFGISSGQK